MVSYDPRSVGTGPTMELAKQIHAEKYRSDGETYEEAMSRIANHLKDDEENFYALRYLISHQHFLLGGRIQQSCGSMWNTTALNCFVMDKMPDSMSGIMRIAAEIAETARLGGGVGLDISPLRFRGSMISTTGSVSAGPVVIADIFDAVLQAVSSSGHRRGAGMLVMRVDHPDIIEFVRSKHNHTRFKAFNLSVAVTDEFMRAVENDGPFSLVFEGKTIKHIKARALWEEIMRSTWEWADPGVLFIDRINHMNNLRYCEEIAAANPCGEQPLPPYGACLLGSVNLTKYVMDIGFNYDGLAHDIPIMVRAMDNVVDRTSYPFGQQKVEAIQKRRIGLGVTGLANAIELFGDIVDLNSSYGSNNFLKYMELLMKAIANEAYRASAMLAKEKGTFPLYEAKHYENSPFVRMLDDDVQELIHKHGLRNSHLLSIAPTGTISLTADNVSSGIEPVWSYEYDRSVIMPEGMVTETIYDYAYKNWGVKGKRATECTIDEHLDVLLMATKWCDSAVSKTINLDPNTPWDEFKDVYTKAWKGGAKGCTVYNPSGKRFAQLGVEKHEEVEEGTACYVDTETGKKECG